MSFFYEKEILCLIRNRWKNIIESIHNRFEIGEIFLRNESKWIEISSTIYELRK